MQGLKITASETSPNNESPLPPEDMEWPKAKGAFQYLDPRLLDALRIAFTARILPIPPIVDLAICFGAAGMYPDDALCHTGFRNEVRRWFHARAKTLFDVGFLGPTGWLCYKPPF
ncbi:hypothetical protein ACHAPJ_013190 [Fusarium lateritium]